MRRSTAVASCILVIAIVSLAAAALYIRSAITAPLAVPISGVTFEVAEGASVQRIAGKLHDIGVLQNPLLMRIYARLTGQARSLQAGEYRIEQGTSLPELVEQFVAGNVIQYRFTIIEGWSVRDLFPALLEHEAITVTGVSADDVMMRLGQAEVHSEGQFFPDTYTFPRGTTDLEILRIAHEAMESVLASAWSARSLTAEVDSAYEALILASIIEKETALDRERREIAGVFNRRLARGMRLETDPTVIYGLGGSFDGNLRRADLMADTPYNTYTRVGLPPTPISMPGLASLEAAIDPAPGDSLFFVATGLPDGSHTFSRTYEEHARAVREYNDRQRESSQ
jgi:UPF0755 protein